MLGCCEGLRDEYIKATLTFSVQLLYFLLTTPFTLAVNKMVASWFASSYLEGWIETSVLSSPLLKSLPLSRTSTMSLPWHTILQQDLNLRGFYAILYPSPVMMFWKVMNSLLSLYQQTLMMNWMWPLTEVRLKLLSQILRPVVSNRVVASRMACTPLTGPIFSR